MKKISRWNRGLLIGAVLIAGVMIFQITDQVRFQKSVPSISAGIQDYMTDCTAAITNAEDPTAARSAFLETVDRFWSSDTRSSSYYYITKSDFYASLSDSADSEEYGLSAAVPLAVDLNVTGCRIQKNGPGACTALVSYEQTSYLDRYGTYLTPFYTDYAYDTQSETGGDETPSSVTDGEDAIRITSQQQVLLQLYEETGEWRIATASLQQGYSDSAIVKRTEVPA
jgi:hypothetical protein